jgi:hypothetical protein
MNSQPRDPVKPVGVGVTGPPRRASGRAPLPRTREIDEETRLGEIFMASLLREQARLAIAVLATLFTTVGALPLVFHLWPGLAAQRALGLPLPWLLLGLVVYPWLLFLGWVYVRAAERNERDFTHVVATDRDA